MTFLERARTDIELASQSLSLRYTFYQAMRIAGRRGIPLPDSVFRNDDISIQGQELYLVPYMTTERDFADVGANRGYWTSRLNDGKRTIYAFEPSPGPYRILEGRFKRSPNVKTYRCALGKSNRLARICLHSYDPINSLVGKVHRTDYLGQEVVQVRTLDSFHLKNIGLIRSTPKVTRYPF